MKNKKQIVGLVGLGYWGKNILRNLVDMELLHSACDFDAGVIAARRREYPGAGYTRDFRDLLENSAIKAIAIASPAVTHYEFAKKALLAGKDVFVEKPLALNVAEGEELVSLAKKAGRILMVGHLLQYHPALIKLKELILQNKLGRIQYVYSNRLNIGKLRTEENILWSFAPHDISAILMLIGEEPLAVSAFSAEYLNKGISDVTLTTLEFKGRVKAHIFVSWLHPYKEQKLIVVGSKAMAVFDDLSKEKLFVYPHKIKWTNGRVPVAEKADFYTVPVDAGEPLRLELTHFRDCVLARKKPRTDGEEGMRVLKILGQAESSIPKRPGFPGDVFIHHTACVDEGVGIGAKTRVWHFSHILKNSRIGKNCVIGQNVSLGPDVVIGDNCKIQNNVSVYKGVTIEDDVFCGPSCVFTNVYNPRAFIERKHEFRQTLVKKGATIGANATVVCGAVIGRYALVGAGAVVKQDVPDHAIVAGVPAKQIGWVCKCGTTLKAAKDGLFSCGSCGNRYRLKKGIFKAADKK